MGFKDSLFGNVPDNWNVCQIGDIAELKQGLQISKSLRLQTKEKGSIPLLKITDLPSKKFSEYVKDISENYMATKDDIIYTRTGQVGLVYTDISGCVHNNCFKVIFDYNKFDKYYMYYYLKSTPVKNYSNAIASGSVQKDLTHTAFKKCLVAYPSLKKQKNIGYILLALDKKIEINNQINENLQSLSQLLFKHWFVDFEFPNEEELPYKSTGGEMVDSELGMIPKAWKVKSIGEITEVIDCLHSKKPERSTEGYPFLQLNNIRDDGLLDITDVYLISDEDYKNWISRVEVSEGDCVITNVGRVGAVSQIPENIKAAIGRNMTCIRCKTSFLFPTFLIECLLSDKMRIEIERKTDSGTILNALNVKNIPKLRFVCPDKEIVLRFEQTVRPIRRLMERNLEESRHLSSIRDTLLPKLMSGEIDLSNLQID